MTDPLDTTEVEATPERARWSFVVSYVAWVVILSATVVTLWWSSAELSAFRYAGF